MNTKRLSGILKRISLVLLFVTCYTLQSQAFDQTLYKKVGDTFTVTTTYKSGAYSILWTAYGLEQVSYIGGCTNSVTFRIGERPTTGHYYIQATTYYMQSGQGGHHTDFWTVVVEGEDPEPDPDPEEIKVTSISLNKISATCFLDKDELVLEATIYPNNATNKKLKWSSSNTDVADVWTADGYTHQAGVISHKCGTTIVTCETTDGSGLRASCEVKVFEEGRHYVRAKTIEGVEMLFTVEDATTGTCEVYNERPIDPNTTGKLTIPDMIDGEIHWNPARGTERLRVTKIPIWAFNACKGLTSVTIPASIESIGEGAFWGCEKLEEISIPDNITEIKKSTFAGCRALIQIVLPSNLIAIGEEAFQYCESLKSITLPDGLLEIKEKTFQDCKSLTHITLPINITSIGKEAFAECESLSEIVIPNGVTVINNSTFKKCSCLKSVSIPNSVTRIGEYAFAESGLTSVSIPGSVISIGDNAFSECKSLENTTLSNGLKYIEAGAFFDTAIAEIRIPSTVESIGRMAFYITNNLKKVYSEIKQPKPIHDEAFYYWTPTLYVPTGCKDIYNNTAGWKKFLKILEEGEDSNNNIVCYINEENFPDVNFRDFLLAQDFGSDGVLTEGENQMVFELQLGDKGITNMQGVEFFKFLTILMVPNNNLTSIDLSKNKELKRLSVRGNKLTSLDVSSNVLLESLVFHKNQIKGKAMDDLIASLPQNNTSSVLSFNCISLNGSSVDGNICTWDQVAAVKAKGWTPQYWDEQESKWKDYKGSDDEQSVMKGDVNGDGEVNGTDLVAMTNMILGKTAKNTAADLNGDGEVNGTDYVTLVNIVLGK